MQIEVTLAGSEEIKVYEGVEDIVESGCYTFIYGGLMSHEAHGGPRLFIAAVPTNCILLIENTFGDSE